MDDEDFLAAVEADNKGVPEEPVKVEVVKEPEPAPEPPTPEPVAEPEKAEPEALELTTDEIVTPKPDAADGRLLALLEERDKRKAAEERARTLEEQMRAAQQQPLPDPYEDPEGFAAVQKAQTDAALYNANLRWSEQLASIKHGEDTVKTAKEWGFNKCNEDPYFNAKVAASPDPIGYVVQEFKREEIASKVTPDEFAQFQAWKTAQNQIQQPAGQTATTNQQPSAIPTPSLASAPSAGNILTEPIQGEEEIFNEVLPKKR